MPPRVEHLHAWIYQLHGKSGVGMEGAAPLTYGTIADWARLTGVEPTGDDVEALMRLDLVMLTEYRAKAAPEPTMQQPPEIPNGSRRR